MRLNITIDDDQAAAVAERATEAHCTRVEWIRRAVSAALDTGLYRLGTLDVSEPVPAPCLPVPDRAPALEEEICRLTDQILEERAQRIADLKSSADKLIEQGERYQVLLQGAQQAALPERAGVRSWWKRLWEK